MVGVKRLELLWISPLEPKSSASTSFAIPAKKLRSSAPLPWRHFVVAIPAKKLRTFLLSDHGGSRRRHTRILNTPDSCAGTKNLGGPIVSLHRNQQPPTPIVLKSMSVIFACRYYMPPPRWCQCFRFCCAQKIRARNKIKNPPDGRRFITERIHCRKSRLC